MTTVNTILGSLYVDDQGEPDEPTALLWPSLFTDYRMWRHQVVPLREASWRTLTLDPPGQVYRPAVKARLLKKGQPPERLGNLKFLAGSTELRIV